MQYETVQAKTLLSKPIEADGWFHTNRSMNLYRGCEHGCIYCDGHCQYYRVDNFYTHIRVKENAPKILEKELNRMGYTSQSKLETETLWSFLPKEDAKRFALKTPRRIVIGTSGGVSDSYQPIEEKYELTRKILEVLLDYRMPIMILTKSDLVLRDLDILKEIHQHAFVNVIFTITTYDEETQKILEPNASSTSDRFRALKKIRKEGLYGGVMSTPVVPWIGDTEENMRALAKEAKNVGAEFILFSGMTLKPGRQKDHFMRVVSRRFPEQYNKIKNTYSNDHTYGLPNWKKLRGNILWEGYKICKEIGISDRSIRHLLPGAHKLNYNVFSKILDIIFYKSMMFGHPRSETKPFYELAVKLERGVEKLDTLRDDGILAERLLLNEELHSIVLEIMDNGSTTYLQNLLSESTETSGDQVFEQFTD